jgi:hypothetical protein
MDDAEREYKRWNDRVNQQYSRARKRRKLEELQSQVKKLTVELETTKVELESYKRRETAVRSALDWVSTIVNDSSSPATTAKHSPKSSEPTPSHNQIRGSISGVSSASPVANHDENYMPHASSTDTSLQTRNYVPPAFTSTTQHIPAMGDFSSTFNGVNGDCVLNLPLEFGDGAWVNLLPTDLWQTSTSGEDYNASLAPLTPDESPEAQPQATPGGYGSEVVSSAQFTGLATQLQLDEATPVWAELPLNVGATNEVDTVLLEVTSVGRQWKSRQGDYHSELSHPSFPSISSLLNRDDSDVEHDRSNNPLAAALGKWTVTTPKLNFPRKVAFHYTVAHLLRWLVNPTEQSFAQLPQFLRPTAVQKTVPHPAWIDTVPWPEARNRIILNLHIFDYELFKRVTRHSCINWPHSDRDIFIAKQGSKQMMLSPKFVRHILNLNNWTNGPDLAKAFPFLVGWPQTPPAGSYAWPE